MNYLQPIDFSQPECGEFFDELPLWSAPFGLRLLDRVPLKPDQTVLDLGAGTGFLTVELAQRCGAGSTVIAVDPWAAAMDRLRRKLEHMGVRNVRLLVQDAESTGLPDRSVDVVVSNLGVNNFENAAAVLREMLRVSKPGARLLLTTNLEGHMAEFYDVFRSTLIGGGQHHRLAVLDEHVRHRGSVDSVRGMLEQAGFVVDRVETDSFRMRFADGSALLRHYFIRLGFLQAWKSVVEDEAVHEIFDLLERNLNAVAGRRGGLDLTVPLACVEARKP